MLIYNIPASALSAYRNNIFTLRSGDCAPLVEAFSSLPKENLLSLQILSPKCDVEPLLHVSDSIPIDIVLDEPVNDSPLLYRFAELTRKHPVRVSIRAVVGMTKAVKIAQALNFSIKIELAQLDKSIVDELVTLAEYYLHGPNVNLPIEPFHSLLFGFYRCTKTNLWQIQDEDSTVDRYVSEEGKVKLSKRLSNLDFHEFQNYSLEPRTPAARGECAACEFQVSCQSYFKFPDDNYNCEYVRRLFGVLWHSAIELRRDEEQFLQKEKQEGCGSEIASPEIDHPRLRSTINIDNTPAGSLSSFSMRRLSGPPPDDFVRLSWATEESQALWQSRISSIKHCIQELEWRTVAEGLRPCALMSVDPSNVEAFTSKLDVYGMIVKPLDRISRQASYVSSFKLSQDGTPFDYWCVIGKASDVYLMEQAHKNNDEESIGNLLGYPPCCIVGHRIAWINEKFIDTTWPMAQNTIEKQVLTPTHLKVTGSSNCNILLRWIGMRSVFHLPCSFDCHPTAELSKEILAAAISLGFGDEVGWLIEMLNWPIQWTALRGFAEVVIPVVTISTSTDVTEELYQVDFTT